MPIKTGDALTDHHNVSGSLFVSGAIVVNSRPAIVAKTSLDVHHSGSLNPVNLANDTGGGEIVYFGTGSCTAGLLYYLNSNGGWQKTNAFATGTAGNAVVGGNSSLLGIAIGTNPIEHGMLVRGYFDANTAFDGSWSTGSAVYVYSGSAGNAGKITATAPSATNSYVRIIGYCTSTEKVIYFNPEKTWVQVS
tara:strand:- start:5052 stop:5627 length:576 start_codon:yes stop_codon:yes gene_type:complete